MSSGGFKTTYFKQQTMTIESIIDNNSTNPAITYSECYRQYGINVLSLFDGMSCGQIALERSGIKVNKYFASEIKPHAIKVTQHNYPNTIQLGDVRNVKAIDTFNLNF